LEEGAEIKEIKDNLLFAKIKMGGCPNPLLKNPKVTKMQTVLLI
jgi:hypothetical protein